MGRVVAAMSRSRFVALELLVFAVALVPMSRELSKPIHGHFYFRQAHVMANIEKYLDRGLSLRPATYNKDIPYSLFDFPAYELLVAGAARPLRADPLLLARLASLACFALTLFLIDRLLLRTGASPSLVLLTLFLFALSPLCLFYFAAPIVDVLAIALSLLSLYAFVRWSEASFRGPWWWAMTASGVLATLIKNPVYLPIPCAVLAFGVATRGLRFAFRPRVVLFLGAVLGAVVMFKLYSNRVNGIDSFLSSSETSAYFGPLEDRLDPRSWERILRVEREEMLNPLTWTLALVGLALYAATAKETYKSLYLGLVAGSALALLVFFQRYTWHDYYQLPLEMPLAFCAAYGLLRLGETAGKLGARLPKGGVAFGLVVPAALGFTLYEDLVGYREMASTPTDWIQRSGNFIRENTSPDDFVVYLLDTEDRRDWNPVFLYFAKRDGYNLSRKRVVRRVLQGIERRFGERYRNVYVFCPEGLWRELRDRLLEGGAELREAGKPGFLYRLDRRNRPGSTSSR